MKISETRYNDAGELLAPDPLDVKIHSVGPGGRPTFDPGFYHQFNFVGATVAEYQKKRARFFAETSSVPGYMTLTPREYEVAMGNFVRYGLDILYVVEEVTELEAAAHRAARPNALPARTVTTVEFTEH